jgi:hypothetical protein
VLAVDGVLGAALATAGRSADDDGALGGGASLAAPGALDPEGAVGSAAIGVRARVT